MEVILINELNTVLREKTRSERLKEMHINLAVLIESAGAERLDMIRYLLSWADSEVERLVKSETADGSNGHYSEMTTVGKRR